MGNWDTSTPLDTDFISLGDDNIREMKAAVQEALRGGTTEGTEAIFPGSAPTTAPVFRYRGLKGATGARPESGQYGLFFDTTRNVLQRDNGSSWEDVGTVIEADSVWVVYQAAAPAGFTKLTTQDNKALRVVSGTGGGSGGTHDLGSPPSLAHTHEFTTSSNGAHDHGGETGTYYPSQFSASGPTQTSPNHKHTISSDGDHTHTGTSDSTTPTAFAPKYIDVIIVQKT